MIFRPFTFIIFQIHIVKTSFFMSFMKAKKLCKTILDIIYFLFKFHLLSPIFNSRQPPPPFCFSYTPCSSSRSSLLTFYPSGERRGYRSCYTVLSATSGETEITLRNPYTDLPVLFWKLIFPPPENSPSLVPISGYILGSSDFLSWQCFM